MSDKQDYLRDIAEMRSMMERSSKFLSLSGWAGIMAGLYALAGAFVATKIFAFAPGNVGYGTVQSSSAPSSLQKVIFLSIAVLVLSIGTAVLLSYRKANRKGEKFWNPTARRLLVNLAVPLFAGGILIVVMILKGLIGFIAPFSLLFYGLSLYNASKFTYEEVRSLGLIEIALGLVSSYFIDFGVLFWAIGFGIVHIIYGVYIHYRYER